MFPTIYSYGIYALAAKKLFPDKTITASLHYLRTNRIKSHTYTEEDLELVKASLVSRIDKIINDQSFAATFNERICSFCDHAASGACRSRSLKT